MKYHTDNIFPDYCVTSLVLDLFSLDLNLMPELIPGVKKLHSLSCSIGDYFTNQVSLVIAQQPLGQLLQVVLVSLQSVLLGCLLLLASSLGGGVNKGRNSQRSILHFRTYLTG